MSDLIPEDMKMKPMNKFLKGDMFEGEGLKLVITGFEVVDSNNPDFGAQETNWLVKDGKLKVGQTIKYSFVTNDDLAEEKIFETTSPGFYIAFNGVDPKKNDILHIKREGKAAKTRYSINKVTH